MLKLYHFPTSVCSIKVRVGLAEIDLDFEEVIVRLPKGEQHHPDYLAINPDGVVPTLIDGDLLIVESSLILEYLDREYNESRLMPDGRSAEMTARHWLTRTLAIHAAINTMTFATGNRDQTLATKTPEEIKAAIDKMPDPIMALKRANLTEHGLASPYVSQALRHLRQTFRDMEAALEHGDWVSGADHGITDIAILSYVDRLERLGFEGLWHGGQSPIGQWLKRMQARPSYDIAVMQQIDPQAAKATRERASKHWPAVEELWHATAA